MDTLDYLGKKWIPMLGLIGSLVIPFGIIVSAVLSFFQFIDFSIGVMSTFIISLILEVISGGAFYYTVKCPRCHKLLNKFKNGKLVPINQAYTALFKGGGCRHCKWVPEKNGID